MKYTSRAFQLLLLIVAATAAIYARTTLGPLQEAMRISLALTDNQIALLQGPALVLPLILGALPLGLAIDRYQRVRLMLLFAVLTLASSLWTAVATSFSALFVARALVGGCGMASFLTAMSLVADLYPPQQRGRATMLLTAGAVAGMSAAFALGGSALAASGVEADGWRWAMAWLAAPLVAAALLMLVLREPARTGTVIARPSVREAYAELWRYRGMIVPLAVGQGIAMIAEGAATIWAAPTLSRQFGLSPDRIGALMGTILLVSGLAGPVLGGVLADACHRGGGPRRTLLAVAVLALLSVPCGLFAVAPGVQSFSVLLTVFITLGAMLNVVVPTLTTVVVPNEVRGTCMSLMSTVCLISTFGVAPLLVSLLSDRMGGPAMLGPALTGICVSSSLIGTLVFVFGLRAFPGTAVRSEVNSPC